MSSRAVVIAHGRLHRHRKLLSLCKRVGHEPLLTESPLRAEHLAASLHSDVNELYVVGGDGTLNEVVNGLMRHDREHRPTVIVVPLGSGNDTYRTLRSRWNGSAEWWDVMQLTYCDEQGLAALRYGINIADVGLGGIVVKEFTAGLRRLPSRIGYAAAVVKGFMKARPHDMRLVLKGAEDSSHIEARMLMISLANGRWFGSGLGIAPQADPTDGQLTLTMIGAVSVATYIRCLPALLRGTLIDDSRAKYAHAHSCVVDAHEPVPIEVDGEYVGTTPLTIEVVPCAIRLAPYL